MNFLTSSLRGSGSSSGSNDSKKSVSFSEDNDEMLIEQIEELDAEALWYTTEEFFEIKLRQRMDAKQWRRSGLSVLLSGTYDNPDGDAQDYLNAYCQLEEPRSRRGLERHLCRKHGEERTGCKERARLCVLLLQERLDRKGWTQEEIAEEMSERYGEIGKQAAAFAHRIAKADEHAAREGECDDAADAILLEHNALMFGAPRKTSRRFSRRRSSGASSLGSVDSCDSFRLPLGLSVATLRGGRPCRPQAPTISEDYCKAMKCLQ